MLDRRECFDRFGRVFQEDQHVNRADGDDHRRYVKRTAPAELLGGPAGDDKGQRPAELVTGADNSQRAPALQRREPIGRDANGRRPSERLERNHYRPR
jgi:hypothetical protein